MMATNTTSPASNIPDTSGLQTGTLPILTSDQVSAIQAAISDTNSKLQAAVTACNNAYQTNAPVAGVSTAGEGLASVPVPSAWSSSVAGVIRQKISSLQTQVTTTVGLGTTVSNIVSSGSYTSDNGARLNQGIKDYQSAAQDCLNQAQQIVTTINQSTLTGAIATAIADAAASLATTLSTLLNALGDNLFKFLHNTAKQLSLGGVVAVSLIGFLGYKYLTGKV